MERGGVGSGGEVEVEDRGNPVAGEMDTVGSQLPGLESLTVAAKLLRGGRCRAYGIPMKRVLLGLCYSEFKETW